MLARVPGDLERAERAALRDMMQAAPPAVVAGLGVETVEAGGATCVLIRGLSMIPELNRVMGLGIDEPATEDGLDAIDGAYAGGPHLICLSPEAQPSDLPTRLAARGYAPGYPWMKFCRTPDEDVTAPTDLRVERIGADRAADFAGVVADGFGMPDSMREFIAVLPGRDRWSCWVAYAGDQPCGAGALFIDGDDAWVGLGATVPAARGRGAQSAILAARVRAAAQAGCRMITTETGVRTPDRPARSYRNILRAGFEEVYERPNWRSPEPLAAA
jgi:GNAT superfamily N-acetyltransferase